MNVQIYRRTYKEMGKEIVQLSVFYNKDGARSQLQIESDKDHESDALALLLADIEKEGIQERDIYVDHIGDEYKAIQIVR